MKRPTWPRATPHALRCMIIDFAEDYDRDPHNPLHR